MQREERHDLRSLHAKDPRKKELINLKSKPHSCVSQCHYPPHVKGFDAVADMKNTLGPGHGM